MTAQEIENYFQYHNSNIELIKIGFDQIRKQIKLLFLTKSKSGDYAYQLDDNAVEKLNVRKIEKSLSRILSGIQVSWAEESIKRLLYEKNLFTESQRLYLLEQSALDQRWYAALRLVFCIAYDLVPDSDETCSSVKINRERSNLGDELVDQYFELKKLITDYLVPNFSIRNKVQHGEWQFAFKPKYSVEFSQDITDKINKENIITTTSRHILVNALYQLIVDLGRFKSNNFALNSMLTPFEYFYKDYIKKINFEKLKIDASDFESLVNQAIDRDVRGTIHREL
jgi:hypothetical protein